MQRILCDAKLSGSVKLVDDLELPILSIQCEDKVKFFQGLAKYWRQSWQTVKALICNANPVGENYKIARNVDRWLAEDKINDAEVFKFIKNNKIPSKVVRGKRYYCLDDYYGYYGYMDPFFGYGYPYFDYGYSVLLLKTVWTNIFNHIQSSL
ncbi:hypothetical protein GJ496_006909 [Pomphorhynchus laevis]|nr:hypothetical protein GJ496_006909 [Pomphorhynchus laevis]